MSRIQFLDPFQKILMRKFAAKAIFSFPDFQMHLNAVNSLGNLTGVKECNNPEYSDNPHHSIALGQAVFKDAAHGPQQANNCVYATAPGGKLIQFAAPNNPTSTQNLVMAYSPTEQGYNGETYLSIPSSSYDNTTQRSGQAKYSADHPIISGELDTENASYSWHCIYGEAILINRLEPA